MANALVDYQFSRKFYLWSSPSLYCIVGLSFELQSGTNILVTGDSGCGKSSLLRVLDGLWPHSAGSVIMSLHDAGFLSV